MQLKVDKAERQSCQIDFQIQFKLTEQSPVTLSSSQHNILHYEKKIGKLDARYQQTYLQLLSEDSRISWTDDFAEQIRVQTISSDLESMVVNVHYGNYKQIISIIFTQIQQKLFESSYLSNGSFGSIYELQINSQYYVMKMLNSPIKQNQISLNSIYKEYFLASIASLLKVGPKVIPIFGYDIAIFNDRACFSMEKCQLIQRKSQMMEKELCENLKILHSIKFVHLDIKPENIGFSKTFKKHIFIDYGLSKLIKQVHGERTLTNFIGSVQFCSNSMRRSIISSKIAEVDLYYNDLVCLQNSLPMFQFEDCNNPEQEFRSPSKAETSEGCIVKFAMSLLKIKYYIYFQRIECLISQIQNNLNCLQMTLYQILTNQNLNQRFKEKEQIKRALSQIKNRLTGQCIQINKIDNYFYNIIKDSDRASLMSSQLCMKHLLQLSDSEFRLTVESNINFVYNLFVILDPFSNYFVIEMDEKALQQCYSFRMSVVEKIFVSVLHSDQSNRLTPKFGKIRSVLLFLYQKLKKFHDCKILFSMRLLFIMMEDWQQVNIIQQQIIKQTYNPKQKVLRIVQIALFSDILFERYDKDRNNQFIEQIKTIEQEIPALAFKGKQIIQRNKVQAIQFQKGRCISIVSQMKMELQQSQHEDILQRITSLYNQFACLSQPDKKQVHIDLTLEVYQHHYYRSLKSKKEESSVYNSLRQIYHPLRFEDAQFGNKKELKIKIYKHFEISKQMGKLLPTFLFFEKYYQNICKDYQILKTIVNLSCQSILSHRQESGDIYSNSFVIKKLITVFWLFLFYHQFQKIESKKQNSEQILSKIYNLFTQVQSSTDLRSNPQILMMVLCLRCLFSIVRQRQISKHSAQLRKLVSFYPIESMLSFQFYIELLVIQFEMKKQTFLTEESHDEIIRLVQICIKENMPYKVACSPKLLVILVQIYNGRGMQGQSVRILCSFIDYTKHDKLSQNYYFMLQQAIKQFCFSCSLQTKKQTLNKLESEMHLLRGYVYFQYQLLRSLICQFSISEISKKVVRLSNSISKLQRCHFQETEMYVYQVYRKLDLCKSKRKKWIMLKREEKSIVIAEKIKAKKFWFKHSPICAKIMSKLQRRQRIK